MPPDYGGHWWREFCFQNFIHSHDSSNPISLWAKYLSNPLIPGIAALRKILQNFPVLQLRRFFFVSSGSWPTATGTEQCWRLTGCLPQVPTVDLPMSYHIPGHVVAATVRTWAMAKQASAGTFLMSYFGFGSVSKYTDLFSSSVIRSQSQNVISLNYTLNLLNNRSCVEKTKTTVFLGKMDAWQWSSAGFLVWALHGLAGGTEGAACDCGGTSCLPGLGSYQAGVCGSKTGRMLCSNVERCWGRGSLGRWVSSWLTAVISGFFPAWSALAEGWGGQMLYTCPIYLLERCLPSLGLSAPLH